VLGGYMDKDLYAQTEGLLYRYKTLVAEAENIKISIEQIKKEYIGCSAIPFEEKSAPTNKFNSSVENEIIMKEEHIKRLDRELEDKEATISKITNAVESLEERKAEIIKLRYFKKIRTWEKVGEMLDLTGEYCRDLNKVIIKELVPIIFIEKYI